MVLKYAKIFYKLLTLKIRQVPSYFVRSFDFIGIILMRKYSHGDLVNHENILNLTESEIDNLPKCTINQKDKLIAQFNQSNEQLNYLQPQSNLHTEFIVRERNVVSLVIHKNQICLMKCYENLNCLINEVRALNRLKEVTGVPKLVDINLFKKQAYQSFIPGTSLSHILMEQGCSEGKIYLYENQMSDDEDYPHDLLKTYGNNLVSEHFIYKFRQLLNDIHLNGVLVRDVKFGNIINHNGVPYLVDFDCASMIKNNQSDQLTTFKENALFNRLLPLNMPTRGHL